MMYMKNQIPVIFQISNYKQKKFYHMQELYFNKMKWVPVWQKPKNNF